MTTDIYWCGLFVWLNQRYLNDGNVFTIGCSTSCRPLRFIVDELTSVTNIASHMVDNVLHLIKANIGKF